MPSPFRDQKSLPEWIELDYYRRPRWIRRWKWLVAVLIFLASIGVVAALTLYPRQRLFYQAAPVAPAHAMFNNDCAICHTQAFKTAERLWPGNAGSLAVPDSACLQCHPGPIHHSEQTTTPGCASCHREHTGKQLLATVDDRHCTVCHADLALHDSRPPPYANVSSFGRDHPEFLLWRQPDAKDPGTIRFNHEVHLQAGLRAPDGKTRQLDCKNCHEPDAQRRYMLPVNYEKHCAECHPLSVQVVGDWKDAKLRDAALKFSKVPAPHKDPAIVQAVLQERLLRFLRENPTAADTLTSAEPHRLFPGKRPPEPRGETLDKATAWLVDESQYLGRQMFEGAAGCRYCHQEVRGRSSDGLPQYALSQLRTRWFEHSRFRHDSHQMLKCDECHAARSSTKSSDILMPKIDSCRQCHHSGGARTACVECHGYHEEQKKRDFHGSMTIEEFIKKSNP